MSDSYDWTEVSDYIIPEGNIEGLLEAVDKLEIIHKKGRGDGVSELETLLKRIEIISNDLDEWRQEAILHKDLATKAQEKTVRLWGLLRRVYKTYLDTGKIPNYMLLETHRELERDKESAINLTNK